MEECANCHRKIGDLETPWLFKERSVCVECYARLTTAPFAMPTPQVATPAPTARPSNPNDVGRSFQSATDAVVGRVIVIVVLLIFIMVCVSVIFSKLTTY